mgnify:FL=1
MASKYKHTHKYLKHRYDLFCKLQKLSEVFDLLRITSKQYKKLTEKPPYKVFKVGKKSGGERTIETPTYTLKKVQERLNGYLQATYYFEKTPLAYGFVTNTRNDKDRRDILSNAQKHLNQPFMLNIDLKDFFHSIEVPQVWKVFGNAPFKFQREAVEALTRLTTYRGRLPMGTPTSPSLSNFAARKLDEAFQVFAEANSLLVTRYVDDVTFSSDNEITTKMLEDIKSLITLHEFKLNEKKVKFYGEKDQKEVTGILLKGDEVALPDSYISELEQEIEQLATVLLVQNQQGKLNTFWVENHKKHVRGKINFLGYVLGNNSVEKQRLLKLYEQAIYPPPEDFGSYSWRSFHYHI